MTPTPHRIRPRVPEDDAFIRELARAAFREYSKDAGRSTLSMADGAMTLVAERDGRPIGFVIIEPDRRGTAYVSALAVTEESRGRGVGGALLRAAENAVRSRGATRLELMTAEANLAAFDLFLRYGFRRLKHEPRTYPRGQHALLLEKPLV